jgi:colicin import membrane protein
MRSIPQGDNVEQADLELQLKVWKELAISKQVLMRGAAEALKLDPDCTQEELKAALEGVTAKIAQAEANVVETQQKAKLSIGVMEQKLTSTVQALGKAEASLAEMRATHENTTKSMAIERASVAQELQKLKDRVAEKDKALKAINTALADTPENVLKKMNALKKQKQEEADARRQVEAALATLRKEKQTQDKRLTGLTENSARLITQYRDLHALTASLHEQLKPLVTDAVALPALPELDGKLIESIESPDAKPEEKSDTKPGAKPESRSRKQA